ncbi:PREDICTED: uncharacterized protein LOC108558475 [Nicrophorus vespilloides]|uniref:Uncharacterized protein LOC108558475 n=1 Tax=Nicrophorus vespilloides TaxID=110193 RepID=A0ABM1M8H9_NICVS|nr:PREDICTED: uncharacterized protein LOC108558475 [Nicrophorus vespilloides]
MLKVLNFQQYFSSLLDFSVFFIGVFSFYFSHLKMTKCCVEGCKKNVKPQHRFPRDSKKCLKWIQAVGRPEFLTMDRDRLCRIFVICDAHFSDRWKKVPFNSKTNLIDCAVPELYLPEPLEITTEVDDTNHADSINKEFSQQCEEHNYCKPLKTNNIQPGRKLIDSSLKSKPSWKLGKTDTDVQLPSTSYWKPENLESKPSWKLAKTDTDVQLPSTSYWKPENLETNQISVIGINSKQSPLKDIPSVETVILNQNKEEDLNPNSNILTYSIETISNPSSVSLLDQLNSADADFRDSDVNNSDRTEVTIITEGSLCGQTLNVLTPDELEAFPSSSTSTETSSTLGKKVNLKRRNNVIFKRKDLKGNLALRVLKAGQLPRSGTITPNIGSLHLINKQYLYAFKNKRKKVLGKRKKSKVVSAPFSESFDESNNDDTTLPSTSIEQGSSSETSNYTLDTKRLLRMCNVSRKNQLSPTALKLYEATNVLKKKLSRFMIDREKNKQKVKEATEYRNYFENCHGNSAIANFLMSQLRHHRASPGARRFSFDDKIYALSLLKLNHQGYNLLQNTFALPSRNTAKSLLNNISVHCGINQRVMNALKQAVDGMSAKDRNCVLMFKEMPLEPTLSYNNKFDRIDGLKHDGETKENRYADHVTVFMAKGLSRQWKQPVAFFFSEPQMSSCDLAKNIKDIVVALRGVGLQVLATVCTDIAVNVNAINDLENASTIHLVENGLLYEGVGFTIGDDEEPIVPLFDVPHMLLGLRNNLLNNNLRFTMQGQSMFASWNDIIQFYEEDQTNEYPLCYKISGKHIYKDKIDKSSVKNAAQLFSLRVSTAIGNAANIPGNTLSRTSAGTAKFIGFVNNLFDSLNCSSLQHEEWAPLKGCVTPKSPHMTFWKEAIQILSSVRFATCNNKDTVAATVANWIKTMTSFEFVWKTLQKSQIKQLSCASLNLQEIENFFQSMRKKGERDSCPNPNSFISSYKNMLINNLMSSDSPGSNGGEKKEQEMMLSILRGLLAEEPKDAQEVEPLQEPLPHVELTNEAIDPYADDIENVIEKLIKAVKGCEKCKESLVYVADSESHQSLMKLLINTFNITNCLLPNICNHEHLMQKICNLCKDNLSMIETCKTHDLFNIAIDACVEKQVISWISKVNDLLNSQRNNNPLNVQDGNVDAKQQIVRKTAKKEQKNKK